MTRFLDPRVPLYKWLANNQRAQVRDLRAKLAKKREADNPDANAAVESMHLLLGRGPIPERAVRFVLAQHGVLNEQP